jgi:RNA polymerase sigma-70 factor (ECF subfamily)
MMGTLFGRSVEQVQTHTSGVAPAGGVLSGGLPEAQFDALVRAHYAKLCGFAYRFVESEAIAEDLVQDVFAAMWERRAAWTPNDPAAFLYRAVRNRAVSHHRRERVRLRWTASIPADVAAPSVAEEYDLRECARAVATAIRALPERCRLVYHLSREDGLSYAEIAAALGVSIKTVETQMGRALRSLRRAAAPHLVRTAILTCVAGVSRMLA